MLATRNLLMRASYSLRNTKTTTGIFGLPVHKNPRPELVKIYKTTLEVLGQMPSSAVYRQATEAITKHRLSIVEETENINQIEEKIASGQIEELIDQAKDEHRIANKMLEWKAWEDLEDKPAPGQWDYFGSRSTASP